MSESIHLDTSREQRGFVRSPFYGLVSLDFLMQREDHPCPYLPGNTPGEEVFRAVEFHPSFATIS
jgi:hypothetical protein